MAVITCKMCGGTLELIPGSAVATCEYCGSRQTVPTADNDKKLNLFARANRLRVACDFDKAAGIYEAIVADFPEEAEAYWGLVLCKYGIEYVTDPATGKKIPTCHRSSFDSVLKDPDLDLAMENADTVARKLYREEAKQIEALRKGIIEVSEKEEAYDIFICYKETDENGDRTLDSALAEDLYEALTEKNYRVFFSRITLEDKLGQEYEPYIFAALNSAKVMLVVGTDYEYFNAVWVKNEWSRFLKLMASDKSKHLIPCYKDIDAYDMPEAFAKLQAQNLGKIGATQDILRGIEKLIPKKNPGVVINESDVYNKTLQEELARNKAIQDARDRFAAEQNQRREEERRRMAELQRQQEEARLQQEAERQRQEEEQQRLEAEQMERNRRDSYYRGLRRNKRRILFNTLIVGAIGVLLMVLSKMTLADMMDDLAATALIFVAPILLPGLALWFDGRSRAMVKFFQAAAVLCFLLIAGICALMLLSFLISWAVDMDNLIVMICLIAMNGTALLFMTNKEDIYPPTRMEKKRWKKLG